MPRRRLTIQLKDGVMELSAHDTAVIYALAEEEGVSVENLLYCQAEMARLLTRHRLLKGPSFG